VLQSSASELGLEISLLSAVDHGGIDAGLPRRGSQVFDAIGVLEHGLGLLEGLARGLGEHEEDVDEHGEVEDAEDDIRLPADVGEGHGGEEAEGRVKGPVARSCQGDSLAPETQRK